MDQGFCPYVNILFNKNRHDFAQTKKKVFLENWTSSVKLLQFDEKICE